MRLFVDRYIEHEGELTFTIKVTDLWTLPSFVDVEKDGPEKIDEIKHEISEEVDFWTNAISIEIYNRLRECQKIETQNWFSEIDPERVTYYFCNDKTIESDYSE